MTKKLLIILFISLLVCAKNSYAIMDALAKVQTGMELYKEAENKLHEAQKFKRDLEKAAKQGFSAASNCFKNPMKCDPSAFESLGVEAPGFIKNKIKNISVMPGSSLGKDDLTKKAGKDMMDDVHQTYIYKRGQGDDLKKLRQNRNDNNAVVSDELAIMFAKGMTTRNAIQAEDGKLYQTEFKNDNIDEILKAQNVVGIATDSRLARILELRAYMVGAEATAELTQQTREAKE